MKRPSKPGRGGRRGTLPRRLALAGLALALFAGAFLGGGFVRFTRDVAALQPLPAAGSADGIVVLTGGEQRLGRGLELLREGKGRRLLVSGVHPGTGVGALARLTNTDRALFECCVDLDHEALDTIGNAEMTVRWAREHGFRRLFLVTSDYHVPRSLLELSGVEGAPEILAAPVSPDKLWRADGWPSRLGLRILATEYAKVLAVRARLAFGVDLPARAHHRVAGRES